MKVLLTGATGFIGRYVLALLQQQQIPFIVLGKTKPDALSPEQFISSDLLTDNELSLKISKAECSHLLHLAWYAEHGLFWQSPLNFQWVYASCRLLEAFVNAGGKHLVVTGTCAEYGWSETLCDEADTPILPATLYGVAKDATRRLMQAYCTQHHVSCIWGRVFLPYGAGEDSRRIIPSLIRALSQNTEAFPVDLEAYRDFIHVSDVAAALLTLLKSNQSGEYNICSSAPVQLKTVVEHLSNYLGRDPSPWYQVAVVNGKQPRYLAGENRKLCLLGWRPVFSVSAGLSQLLSEV